MPWGLHSRGGVRLWWCGQIERVLVRRNDQQWSVRRDEATLYDDPAEAVAAVMILDDGEWTSVHEVTSDGCSCDAVILAKPEVLVGLHAEAPRGVATDEVDAGVEVGLVERAGVDRAHDVLAPIATLGEGGQPDH